MDILSYPCMKRSDGSSSYIATPYKINAQELHSQYLILARSKMDLTRINQYKLIQRGDVRRVACSSGTLT